MFFVDQGHIECNSEYLRLGVVAIVLPPQGDFHVVCCPALCLVKQQLLLTVFQQ